MKLLDYNLEKLKSKNEYLYDCINTILADQRMTKYQTNFL